MTFEERERRRNHAMYWRHGGQPADAADVYGRRARVALASLRWCLTADAEVLAAARADVDTWTAAVPCYRAATYEQFERDAYRCARLAWRAALSRDWLREER